MVRAIILGLALISWSLPKATFAEQSKAVVAQLTSDIKVRLSPKEVMLGDSVILVVKGERIAEAVSKIDFSLFTENFVIDDIIQDSDLLRVRLYPLKSGKFVIPAQRAGFLNIPEFRVEVTKNPDVDIEWMSPQGKAYSQQLVAWNAQVSVSDPATKVSFEEQSHNQNKGLQISMSEQGLNQSNIDQSRSVLDAFSSHTHEMVSVYGLPTFYRDRVIEIHSPAITVKNRTRKRWKFFDAPQKINIKTLPIFLPMSAPIGEIEWHFEPLDRVYEAGSLHYWKWQLKADNLSEDYLKGAVYQLLRQLETAENIQFLSENMSGQQQFAKEGVSSQLEVNLPFRVLESGWSNVPELSLSFFNPQTGLVEQQNLSSHFVVGLPSWLVWVLKWVLFIVALITTFILLLAVKQAWTNYHSLQKIRQADDLNMLWRALQTWRNHHDWRLNLSPVELDSSSLGQWQGWYSNHCSTNEEQVNACEKWVEALNRVCYAGAEIDPQAYRNEHIDKMVDDWLTLQPFMPQPCHWLSWLKNQLQNKF